MTDGAIGELPCQDSEWTVALRLAFEACPFGLLIIDSRGAIACVNAEIERLFGYDAQDLAGRSADLLVPARLRGREALQKARPAGEHNILLGLRSDGGEFLLEAAVTRLRADARDLSLTVIFDASERRRFDEMKHDFISTASHELRTPLTSIAGSLALLLRQSAETLSAPTARLIRIAHDNSQRLVRLINDLLDLEKIESGQVAFVYEKIALAPLLEQLVDINRASAENCGVSIRIDSARGPGVIACDADRLTQVLANLLSNAIKFSPPGGEVVVSTEKRGAFARVSVRDQGPGVPAEFRPRVFERFAQAESAGPKTGSGLGLSIVKEIVTRLGGATGFDDAPGGGAIFHIDLPMRDHRMADHAVIQDAAAE